MWSMRRRDNILHFVIDSFLIMPSTDVALLAEHSSNAVFLFNTEYVVMR